MKYLGYKIINQKNQQKSLTQPDTVETITDDVSDKMTTKSSSYPNSKIVYGALMVLAGAGLYLLSSGSNSNTLLVN